MTQPLTDNSFLAALPGEMAARLAVHNWQESPFGPPAAWPAAFRVTLSNLLSSAFPMVLLWGPGHRVFYNDAYLPLLAEDSPAHDALALPAATVFGASWQQVAALVEGVLANGNTVFYEDVPTPTRRHGRVEELFWTSSLSPVRGDDGRPEGVLVVCKEASGKIARYRSVMQQSKAIIAILMGEEFTIAEANPAALEMWGAGPEIIGRPLFDVLPEMVDQGFPGLLRGVLHSGKPFQGIEIPARFERPGAPADTRYFNIEYNPYHVHGSVAGVLLLATDVTESVRARQQQAIAEDEVEAAIAAADLGYWHVDPRTNSLRSNRRTRELFGLPPDEEHVELGLAIEAIHPDDRPRVVATIGRTISNPAFRDYDIEYRVVHPVDGVTRYVRAIGKSYFDEGGAAYRFSGTIQDVTPKKLAEEALRVSGQRFSAAVQAVQGILWTNTAEGRMEGEQPGWSALTGQTRAEYEGYGWANVVHPADAAATVAAWEDAVRGRKNFVFEHRLRRHDGSWGQFSIQAVPVLNNDGSIREWVGVHTDITAQRNAEAALREATARQEATLAQLESMLQNAPIGFAFFSHDHRYVRVNDALAAANGRPASEHIGLHIRDVIGEQYTPMLEGIIDQVFATGAPVLGLEVEFSMPHEPGTARTWHTGFYPVRNTRTGVVDMVGAVLMDITDLRAATAAARRGEEELRLLADFMPQIVWSTDAKGFHDFYNKRWYEFTGLSYEETKGTGWGNVLHPDDVERSWAAWKHSIETGAYYEIDYRMRRADGQYRWLLGRATPIRDESGAITRWFGTCTDIHDQKSMAETLERLVAERTLELQRSNEDLQQFAHVASHDLKEPVRKIATFENRLSTEFGHLLPERGRTYLQKIEKASRRMYAMIDGVLRYSSLNEGEHRAFEAVDLNEVLTHIASDLEVLIEQKRARIERGPLPTVPGAPTLLYQLFYNIINNALKFGAEGRPTVIRISADEVPASEGRPAMARIRIRDNGIGFDSAEAERIFKTFTRLHTKDHYEGTGLGLALCKKIVDRHGGSIRAEGEHGEGALFELLLPLEG
ncbi:PAS domain-containing sensor histidine kinase [Flaviaesturariibacter amylovorans]|uniref:histidine kinase n=1 Tax=Flaviaesturariibacter amylovorans TaxID=1084520 RepID=A0ABP8G6B7_9BACT